VGEQRQHSDAEGARLASAHLGQQQVGQVVVDLRAGLLGRLGDRHPQLPLGHRRDQVPVLNRAGQLRVLGAPSLKVGAHSQHDQRRRGPVRAVPGGGDRVQRGDERPPLLLIRALGEQLPGQAQRAGQQHCGVLAGGAVDAPLQVTDRPRAHGRRLGQLLLGQPGLSPQLPQQPGEVELRHR
jgi:hypothetical protein